MANPTDSLPTFAVQGLPATMNPIPQVQPNLPPLAQQQPVIARPVVPPAGFVPRGPTPYGVPGQPIPGAAPATAPVAAPAGQPLNTAALNAATQGPPVAAAMPAQPAGTQNTAAPSDTSGSAAVATPERPTIPVFNPGRGAAPGMPSTAQLGPFRDPQQAISTGFDRQQAYAQNFLDQGLAYISGGNSIWERATRGRAVAGILHAVAGQNNEGSVQGAGVNGLNNAVAGVTDADINSGTQMYNADVNRENVTDENTNRYALGRMSTEAGTSAAGSTQSQDSNGIWTNQTNYIGHKVGAGGMVTNTPIVPAPRQASAPKLIENATSTDQATGKPIKVVNGQWTFQ